MLLADVEKPSFGKTCPQGMRVYAERGVNYTRVTWPPVLVTDNSKQLPVTVSTGVMSTYDIGKHAVTYTSTDTAGNKATCSFEIIVEGTVLY